MSSGSRPTHPHPHPHVEWHKSTYSNGSGGECVEVGAAQGCVLVRDSKDAGGAELAYSAAAWGDFIAEVRAGGLGRMGEGGLRVRGMALR